MRYLILRSPLGLLSLDQEKAFDRFIHGFLQRVLTKITFPQHLIHWMEPCYQNIESRVLVIQNPHRPIPYLSRCTPRLSLTPLLYVMYLEPFHQKSRSTPGIPGYQMLGAHGERLIVVAYMDDGTDSHSIATATKVEDYCAATGALISCLNRDHQAAWGHLPEGWRWL